MSKVFLTTKGMEDILPKNSNKWEYVEHTIKNVLDSYGYSKIIFPIVAHKNMFDLTIESSTIVTKEMFELKGAGALVLRPEGTVMCSLALLRNGYLRHEDPIKVWYYGPMFRYERPQKGRLRQFYQIGIEYFNAPKLSQEIEIILIIWRIFKNLNISNYICLELNNIGDSIKRQEYIKSFIEFLKTCDLTDQQKATMEKNPLRLLDTKEEYLKSQLIGAPCISDFIGQESKTELQCLVAILEENLIPHAVNYSLVRGLDYYSDHVFEWRINLPNILGAQDTICAGGRFDTLFTILDPKINKNINSFGCAFGMERLILILEKLNLFPDNFLNKKVVYIFHALKDEHCLGLYIREKLISQFTNLQIYLSTYKDKSLSFHIDKSLTLKAKFVIQIDKDKLFYSIDKGRTFISADLDTIFTLLRF